MLPGYAKLAQLISSSGLAEDPHEGSNGNYRDNDDGY
jgi:hypothetical protein